MRAGFSFVAAGAGALLAGCTLVHVDADGEPPRVESGGVIDGHLALGVREDDELLRLELFEGRSNGALGELTLWKLLRLEVGLLGVGVGVGPFDAALGLGFYDPEVPEFEVAEHAPPARTEPEAEEAPPNGP